MQRLFNKNTYLTALLILVALAIVMRITPPFVSKVVALEIHKNKQPIQRIDQARDIEYSRTIWVDQLDLFHRNQFRHPKIGQIGYTHNFFVDVDHEFNVKQAGMYHFLIGSDDGFKASIDGVELCRFDRDRPYTKQSCQMELDAGEHQFELSYFQAGSGAGLTVEYRPMEESKTYFFGNDSKFMEF